MGSRRVVAAIAPSSSCLQDSYATQYYILQAWIKAGFNQAIVPTQMLKSVVYAFPTLQDTQAFGWVDPQVIAVTIRHSHLFQLVALKRLIVPSSLKHQAI